MYAERASKVSSFGVFCFRAFLLPLDELDRDILAEFSPVEALSLVTDSWKSPKMRSLAALYWASRSSRVSFDLSLFGVPSIGDMMPSSLVVSKPASEVAFEGAEELAGVLAPAEPCRRPSPPLRIILKVAAEGGCNGPAGMDSAKTCKGVGLEMSQ
jgi:hypothetical protein